MSQNARIWPNLLGLGGGLGLGAALWSGGLAVPEAALAGGAVFLTSQVWAERRARLMFQKRLAAENQALQDQTDALVGRLEDMAAQMAALSDSFVAAASKRDARLVKEMKVIETLVARLATGIDSERAAEAKPKIVQYAPPVAPAAPEQTAGTAAPSAARRAQKPPPPKNLLAELSEIELLEVIRSALEDNRIDLYLQPVVTLPQRKTKYYEGLARLRSLDGDVIEPEQFIEVAERAGLMPIVDNLLLFRCVQIVRRLIKRHSGKAIFCNMSGHSLSDPDFFPQFLEFMTENKQLAKCLVFEFSQETISQCGPEGETNLKALLDLGFEFSLDHLTNFRLDFGWLRRHHFKYVKIGASDLTLPHDGAPPEVSVDNLLTQLGRQGIVPIVEKVEDESQVLEALDFDISLGQGFLFGPPRPIKRHILEADEEGASAA